MANPSFSEYYAKAQRESQQGAVAPVTPLKIGAGGGKPFEGPAKPFNFLDTAIDLISRPLYGITETAQSLLENIDAARTGKSDPLAEIGKTLSAPVRGLFSTNPEDKPMGHELVEQATDVFGKFNANYEDVQDNVDPIAKGIAGFGIDVLADPLTWATGGINKLVKLGAQGAKELIKAGAPKASEIISEGLSKVRAKTPAGKAAAKAEGDRLAEEVADEIRKAQNPEPIAPPTVVPEAAREAAPEIAAVERAAAEVPEATAVERVAADVEKSIPEAKAVEEAAVAKGVAPETALKAYMDGRRLARGELTPERLAEVVRGKPEELQEFVQKGIDEVSLTGRGISKRFTDWYAEHPSAAAHAAEAATPTPAVSQYGDYPTPDELLEYLRLQASDIPLAKTGKPKTARVKAAMEAMRADPKMGKLLDEEIIFPDGDRFPVSDYALSVFNNTGKVEDLAEELPGLYERLGAEGKFDISVSAADELAPSPAATPLAAEAAGPAFNERRFEKARQLMERLTPEREGPETLAQFITRMATDPETKETGVGSAYYVWDEIPQTLAEMKKTSKAYADLVNEIKGVFISGKHPRPADYSRAPIDRFHHMLESEDGLELAEEVLTGKVVSNLRVGNVTAERFEIQMRELGEVFARLANFQTVARDEVKYGMGQGLLEQLGIGEAEQLVRPGALSASAPGLRTAADAVLEEAGRTLGDLSTLSAEERVVRDAVIRRLGKDIFRLGLEPHEVRRYVSSGGAAKTEAEIGKGLAVWETRLNGPKQHGLSDELYQYAIKHDLPTPGSAVVPKGVRGATKLRDKYMAYMQVVHQLINDGSISPHLSIATNDVMMTDYKMRQILHRVDDHSSLALLYNAGTRLPTSNLYAAISAMLRGADDTELIQILKKQQADYTHREYKNPLDETGGTFGSNTSSAEGMPELPFGGVRTPHKSGPGHTNVWSAEGLTEMALDLLRKAEPSLRALHVENTGNWNARGAESFGFLQEQGLQRLHDAMVDPVKAGMGASIRDLARVDDIADELVTSVRAPEEVKPMLHAQMEAQIDPIDKIAAVGADRAAEKQLRTGDPVGGAKEAQATHNKISDQVMTEDGVEKMQAARALARGEIDTETAIQHGVTDETADETRQAAVRIDVAQSHTAEPGLFGKLGTWFKHNYKTERVHKYSHAGAVQASMRRSLFLRDLGKLVAKHGGSIKGGRSVKGSDTLRKAWQAITAGREPTDPAVLDAYNDLNDLFGRIMDPTSKYSLLGSRLFRDQVAVDHLNVELTKKSLQKVDGSPAQFSLALATDAAEASGRKVMDELVDQWRTWDFHDPAEGMLKLFAATEAVSAQAAVGRDLHYFAVRNGFHSAKPKPGFAQVTSSKPSIIVDRLKQEGGYYDVTVLKEIAQLQKLLDTSTAFEGGAGQFMAYFDAVQQSWKFGMTVLRPGHHTRNLLGDSTLTYLAEGMRFAVKANTDAWKVLSTLGWKYDGFDFSAAMEGHGFRSLPNSSDVLMSGEYGEITMMDVWEAFVSRGLLNSYHHSEDVIGTTGKFGRVMEIASLRGGKTEKIVGTISEARDHYSRMQHFLQYIYKAQKDGGRGKGIDDLFDNAAHQVKKYHPDGSMLTPFEKKYLRRIIPFYAWFRGAIPAIIEGAALAPHRVMVFPKASYNLAVSMGVNPDSLANPFPEDQLFPSYLTNETLGPQFGNAQTGYWGINPGVATVDVADQFLGGNGLEGPWRGVAGMITPFVRVPFEIMGGGTWGSGSRINDVSDQIDASLPTINWLSSVTGTSITGSASSLISGGGIDPQYQVWKGNKTPEDQFRTLRNLLHGMKEQSMSEPNQIKSAEFELRNQQEQAQPGAKNPF